jgi:hypothetical protein
MIAFFSRKHAMIMSETNLPELETELSMILRWEEDGGKIIEINHSTHNQKKEEPDE